ncbi:pentatricopeptide repeat-containing protein [Canna indica]|uniref:Pentatricopeptide repeat-containing protein n=1 Tax=Canna indica TaxID=4628 RepID=A0AAQ3QG40_9LILI|nr:pentatricopeptide repeat-containing protein [Canna indica]
MSGAACFADARAHLVSALDACIGDSRHLKRALARAVVAGLLPDPFVSARAVAAAAPCDLPLAYLAFRAAVPRPSSFAFASLIRAHSASLDPSPAFSLFAAMLRSGLYPDRFVLLSLLRASARCTNTSPSTVLFLHAVALRRGLHSDLHVATSLLHAYASLGLLDVSLKLLDEMPQKSTVTYNALISCCAKSAWYEHGLDLFTEMLLQGTHVNADTLVAGLSCCAGLGALGHGRSIHACAVRRLSCLTSELGTSLLQMYTKCGSLEEARRVFDQMQTTRDVSAWTAMMSGLAMHGQGEEALDLFERMMKDGVAPDSMAFTTALHACSHCGLFEAGAKIFKEMKGVHGIEPRMEHFGIMVDLLGRAGQLEEAMQIVESMPSKPSKVVLGALLHASMANGETMLRKQLERQLLELETEAGEEGGFFVGVSNLYAAVGRWNEVCKIRNKMVEKGLKKEKGFSLVEVDGKLHKFLVADKRHPLTMEMYRTLHGMDSGGMMLE